MSKWLSRPLIIDHSSSDFETPNLRMEDSDAHPGLPSPFTSMALQGQIAYNISSKFGDSKQNFSPEHVMLVQNEIDHWIESFPPVYRISKPDTSWDMEHSYVVLQRRQLHMTAYMMKLDPLKPYLVKKVNIATPCVENDLRALGVDCSLKLIGAARKVFDLLFPDNEKSHYVVFYVVFCAFDTAAILCSALIHDNTCTLPQRQNIREAIDEALFILEKLSDFVKIAAMSYNILSRLVVALPKSSPITTLSSLESPETPATDLDGLKLQLASENASGNSDFERMAFPNLAVDDSKSTAFMSPMSAWQFSQAQLFYSPELGDLPSLDLGELGQIWDWETLNLDLTDRVSVA